MRGTLPAVPTGRNSHNRLLEQDDRAQDLTAVHLVERRLDIVEPDGLRDELLQRQPTLQVQVDEQREVATRQAVAVPRRLHRTTASEQVDEGKFQPHVGCRNADEHRAAGEVTTVEGLRERLWSAHFFDDDAPPEPAGELLDRLDGV